jgi:hypothetical protein
MPPLLRSVFATHHSNPSFQSFDSGRFSAGHCLRRGDPFSHPSGSSAWRQVRALHPHLNRKGGRKRHTPPARCFCRHRPNTRCVRTSRGALIAPFLLFKCMTCFHLPTPGCRAIHFSRLRPSRFSGTRKRSVPVRVHSVPKSFGFTSHACAWPASNPFLTHGTVESPAKLLPLQITAKVTECDRLQSVLRALRQPFHLAGRSRSKSFRFSFRCCC